MADLNDDKNALRVRAAELRRVAHAADLDGQASLTVRDHCLATVPLERSETIAGYWPIGTELDVRPLLTALHDRGHTCALPVAHGRQPLVFHPWRPKDRLVPGVFGILMPDPSLPPVTPDVLLMPLLAFDHWGNRLGYGAGYYDRTIAAIRQRKTLRTVGIAYAAQEVEKVPADQFDQPLEWVVTEKGARRMERRRFEWLRRFLMS
jgi:5-formyltetrahydrofolate cyclo-ligase